MTTYFQGCVLVHLSRRESQGKRGEGVGDSTPLPPALPRWHGQNGLFATPTRAWDGHNTRTWARQRSPPTTTVLSCPCDVISPACDISSIGGFLTGPCTVTPLFFTA